MGKSFRSDVVIKFASHRKVPGSKPGRNSVFEVFQQSGVFDMNELKYKHDAWAGIYKITDMFLAPVLKMEQYNSI